MDAEKFGRVLEGFISQDADIRKQAEEAFTGLKQQQPDELAALLMSTLQAGDAIPQERRQQAAVAVRNFLRELINNYEDNVWVRLTPTTKASLKAGLIQQAVVEQNAVVRRAIGDIISDVGSALMQKQEWPELAESIFKMMSHADVPVQILGINICAQLEASLSNVVCDHISEIASMLRQKLEVKNNGLRVASIGLITQIVANEMRSVWRVFEDFVPAIMQIMIQTAAEEASGEDTDSLVEILQKLIECAEGASEYFKPHAKVVLDTGIALCRNTELEDETRQFAAEFVMTVVEQKPKMCSKIPGFLDSMVLTLMDFMLDIEEDKDWLERELTCEDDEETRNFDVGEYGLDRVARVVGGDILMPIIFNRVGQFLQMDDWKRKVAGIVAISQTVEYLPESKVDVQLGEVVNLLLTQTTNAHYRVRFAACRALGQVALDHQPYVQENYHDKVLPALIATFDDAVARVQSQALAAFVNFAEEVDIEDLMPHVQGVMEKVLVRMDLSFSTPADSQFDRSAVIRQHRSIREQCITSVAVISGVLAEQFMPWCPRIVPLMKTIVAQCTGPEDRQLRGRALECLSIIAYSVGVQAMGDDCVQIVSALVNLYKTDLEINDPVRDYVHEALRRMIKVLGAEFAPFVPEVLPRQIAAFDFQAERVNPDKEDAEDYTLVCLTTGDFSGVKTSKLETIEKELALMSAMIESMSGAFCPWVQQAMSAVVPLLEMKFSDSVRRLSLVCIADLVGASKAGNASPQQISQWTLFTMENVFKCVADEEEMNLCGIDHLTANISGLARCLNGAGPNVLEAAHVGTICQKVFELIEQSSQRRLEIAEAKKDPDCDEEEAERCDEEAEREQVFRETTLRVLEAIIKHHSQHFLSVGAPIALEFIRAFIVPTRPADDRSLAIFICCDILEQLGATGVQLLDSIVQQVIVYTHDNDATVRQASCFAMSLCMKMPSIDAQIVLETAKRLVAVVNAPNALDKENRDATENAISGLLSIVSTQAAHLGAALQDHANLVVQKLPLVSDDEEAQKVHKAVVTMLESDACVFWGTNKSNVPQLVKVMAAIYKTHLSENDTDAAIRQLISTKIGFSNLPAIVGGITIGQTERRGLQKLERDLSAASA